MAMAPEVMKMLLNEAQMNNNFQLMRRLLRQACENIKESKDISLSLTVIDGIVNHQGLADYLGTTRRGVLAQVQQGELGDIAGGLVKDLKVSMLLLASNSMGTQVNKDEIAKLIGMISRIIGPVDTPEEAQAQTRTPTPFPITPDPTKG